jgi:hypothetical protein
MNRKVGGTARKGWKRKSFCGAKDWSGQPGFRRPAPEMRPKKEKNEKKCKKIFQN